ncbi:hypothetical protein KAU33_10800 [Candidatus Dependentiae bacterium]|nr:hypothetical protein [Candidatus Dependentiae bacterium]
MAYKKLLKLVVSLSEGNDTFDIKSQKIVEHTNSLSLEELINVIENIHVIPESLPHDSTEEKLYAKLSDDFVKKCLKLGYNEKELITISVGIYDIYDAFMDIFNEVLIKFNDPNNFDYNELSELLFEFHFQLSNHIRPHINDCEEELIKLFNFICEKEESK